MKLSTKTNLEGGADLFIGTFVLGMYLYGFFLFWSFLESFILIIISMTAFSAYSILGAIYVVPWCANMVVDGWYSILLARKQREDFT